MKPPKNSSFDSVDDANYYVNDTINYNLSLAKLVASGALPGAFLVKRYEAPTGRLAYWDDRTGKLAIGKTFAVGVLILSDPSSPNGFRVHTAYPLDEIPEMKSFVVSADFRRFAAHFLQEPEIFVGEEDMIRFALQHLDREDPHSIGRLVDFLKKVLRPTVSDAQLQRLWNESPAGFQIFGENTTRIFLSRCLKIAETEGLSGNIQKSPVRLTIS